MVCYCHSSLKAVEWVLPPQALGNGVKCLFDDGFSISEGNGMLQLLYSSQFHTNLFQTITVLWLHRIFRNTKVTGLNMDTDSKSTINRAERAKLLM